ncbi:DUF5680 domain-containing protein [Spirochaeta cellobiosiphila]|uniref:DUF5680 domain-containing protein n=1 Tax=Spirochaeta cellobiosiphila TaxID=504483 RepID=UPI0003FD6B07|nr:DUF5680 domain-containing protein [Spirochaeta cellobiosiphila]
MNIGKRIQELRVKIGFTQEQLADKLGLSRQSIAKWEHNDSTPDINNLIELSNLFNIPIDYIVKGPNPYQSYKSASSENLDDIKNFLCTAKKNTYAGNGSEIKSCRPLAHDLLYEEENLSYLDSYFGGEKFIGEEVLYLNSISYWAMNYSGHVLDGHFSGDFLKECLALVSPSRPYRGPEIYQKGHFTYYCHIEGDFEWFQGDECIYFNSVKVYKCIFHGGLIK